MTNTSNQRKVICDNLYYEKKGTKVVNIQKEIPFEIPETWRWIRLNDIGSFKKGPFGSSLTKEMFVPTGYKVYEQKNAIQKDSTLGHYFITKEKFEEMKGFVVNPGDIIVSCAGTIGEIFVLPENSKIGIINQALMRIKLFDREIENYFIVYFDSVLKREANEKGNGTGMKNIPPFDILKQMLLPLPPAKEMKAIEFTLSKIEAIIQRINLNFMTIQMDSDVLKHKILESVFGENSSYKSYYQQILLKDVCKLDKGQYTSGKVLPYLEAKVIRGIKEAKIIDSGILIEKGTDVILVDGENSGEVMTAPCDGYMGSTFRILKADYSKVTRDYLLLFLLFNKQLFKDNKKGSAIPHLNKKIFNELKIVIPDLTAQQSITKKINNELALLDLIG